MTDDDDPDAAYIDPESAERMVFGTDEYHYGWALHAIAAAAAGDPLPEPRPPHPPSEWIYFVQAGDHGPIKIGYSRDPAHRFATLQTGAAVKYHYLGNEPGTREAERILHARFWASHVRGEWFEPTAELLAHIEEHRFRPDSVWAPESQPERLF